MPKIKRNVKVFSLPYKGRVRVGFRETPSSPPPHRGRKHALDKTLKICYNRQSKMGQNPIVGVHLHIPIRREKFS